MSGWLGLAPSRDVVSSAMRQSQMLQRLSAPTRTRLHLPCTTTLPHHSTRTHQARTANQLDILSPARATSSPCLVFPHLAYQNLWPLKATIRPTATSLPPTTNHQPQWHLPHLLRQLPAAMRVPREQSPAQNCKCRHFCDFVSCVHMSTALARPLTSLCLFILLAITAHVQTFTFNCTPPLYFNRPPPLWTVLTTMLLIGLDGQTVPRKHFGDPHMRPRFPDRLPSQLRAMFPLPILPQIPASTSPRTHNPGAMAA
jgi:hypothetical protein